jgi:hypothetical protein
MDGVVFTWFAVEAAVRFHSYPLQKREHAVILMFRAMDRIVLPLVSPEFSPPFPGIPSNGGKSWRGIK